MYNISYDKDGNESNTMTQRKKDFIEYLQRSIKNKTITIEEFYNKNYAIVKEYGKYLKLTVKDMEDALSEHALTN